MTKKRATILIAVIAVVALAVLVRRLWQARTADGATAYETVPARRDTLLATVTTSGSVMPAEQVTLSFSTSGTLAEVRATVGQRVAPGQELASLDTRQLQLTIDQAEATLRINEAHLAQIKAGPDAVDLSAAEAAVESAQALYDSAKNKLSLKDEQLSVAEADLKRAELALRDAQAAYDLIAWRPEIGMLPQSGALQRATLDYERAQANYKLQVAAIDDSSFKGTAAQLAQAKAQLEKLRHSPTPEDLAIAEAQVQQADAALEQARLRLADGTLVAPIAGTVVSVGAKAGELVGPGTPAVVLADLDRYYVKVSIDEVDVGRVQVGQDAEITLDAFADVRLQGRVTRIDDLATSTQGVISYAAELEILSNDVPLRPGMTATAETTVAKREGVIIVPNRSLRRESAGRYYVEVLANGKVSQRVVSPGLSNELFTEIAEGLQEGDEVVVSAPRRNVLESFGGSPFQLGGTR